MYYVLFQSAQAVKRELKVKWKENKKKEEILPSFDKSLKKELKGYIEYCTRFSWRAVTQVPPLKIDYNSWTFNPLSHSESQAFSSLAKPNASQRWASTQGGKRIYCYLWPTLYDWENRVIAKGDVVLTERSSVGSYVWQAMTTGIIMAQLIMEKFSVHVQLEKHSLFLE